MRYLALFSLLISPICYADFENYDEIVDKLSNYKNESSYKAPRGRYGRPAFSTAHIGLGLSQTFYDADSPAFENSVQRQGGLLINVGVDVLSNRWGVEGSFANFGNRSSEKGETDLREFALKFMYKPRLANNWVMRVGLGMSARYLDVTSRTVTEVAESSDLNQTQVVESNQSYRTPSALAVMGFDCFLNNFISVGADFNFKTAMIDDTIDENSVDLSFRLDTHF